LAYYASLKAEYQAQTSRETGQAVAVIQQLQNMGQRYKVEGMEDHFKPIFEEAQGYYTKISAALPQQNPQNQRR
jgi:hypothetical protein